VQILTSLEYPRKLQRRLAPESLLSVHSAGMDVRGNHRDDREYLVAMPHRELKRRRIPCTTSAYPPDVNARDREHREHEAEEADQYPVWKPVANVAVVQPPKPRAAGIASVLPAGQINVLELSGVAVNPEAGVPTVTADIEAAPHRVWIHPKLRDIAHPVRSRNREPMQRRLFRHELFRRRLCSMPVQLGSVQRLRQEGP